MWSEIVEIEMLERPRIDLRIPSSVTFHKTPPSQQQQKNQIRVKNLRTETKSRDLIKFKFRIEMKAPKEN